MASRTHELKCWPEPFDAVLDGRKRFEWRLDDRGFAVGDILVLVKFDPHRQRYLGEHGHCVSKPNEVHALRVRVEYILRGQFGVPERYIIMGISEPMRVDHGEG